MAENNEGWIEWKGGKRPVAGSIRVEVEDRSGLLDAGEAREFLWHHGPAKHDIVAYRTVTAIALADLLHRAAIKLLDELTHAYVTDEAKAELRAAINAYEASK